MKTVLIYTGISIVGVLAARLLTAGIYRVVTGYWSEAQALEDPAVYCPEEEL